GTNLTQGKLTKDATGQWTFSRFLFAGKDGATTSVADFTVTHPDGSSQTYRFPNSTAPDRGTTPAPSSSAVNLVPPAMVLDASIQVDPAQTAVDPVQTAVDSVQAPADSVQTPVDPAQTVAEQGTPPAGEQTQPPQLVQPSEPVASAVPGTVQARGSSPVPADTGVQGQPVEPARPPVADQSLAEPVKPQLMAQVAPLADGEAIPGVTVPKGAKVMVHSVVDPDGTVRPYQADVRVKDTVTIFKGEPGDVLELAGKVVHSGGLVKNLGADLASYYDADGNRIATTDAFTGKVKETSLAAEAALADLRSDWYQQHRNGLGPTAPARQPAASQRSTPDEEPTAQVGATLDEIHADLAAHEAALADFEDATSDINAKADAEIAQINAEADRKIAGISEQAEAEIAEARKIIDAPNQGSPSIQAASDESVVDSAERTLISDAPDTAAESKGGQIQEGSPDTRRVSMGKPISVRDSSGQLLSFEVMIPDESSANGEGGQQSGYGGIHIPSLRYESADPLNPTLTEVHDDLPSTISDIHAQADAVIAQIKADAAEEIAGISEQAEAKIAEARKTIDALYQRPADDHIPVGQGGARAGGDAGAPRRPAVLPDELPGAGARWTRGDDGWYASQDGGSLERGPDSSGQPVQVEIPPGSRAVFDGSGQLRHVVLPDGVSYERDLNDAWSAPRERPGELLVLKFGKRTLPSGDGKDLVVLGPDSEEVRDNGVVVAYRMVKAEDGSRLSQPRIFLPDGDGWAEHSPVDAATYEAWLASANKAHDAARSLYDIAAQSGPEVPESLRLTSMGTEALKGLLRGSREDVTAAVYELVRRAEGGVALRWTQMSAAHTLDEGNIANMRPGEGKSWLFLFEAVQRAVRPGVDAVHALTSRGHLADREFEVYVKALSLVDIKVHRMNSDTLPPEPVDGQATIYVGTGQDVGFTRLKTGMVPGEKASGHTVIHAVVDEIDEVFVYSNASYVLSEGVAGPASEEVAAPVKWAQEFLANFSEADFGRAAGQAGGPAALTEEGLAKAGQLLGEPLSDAQVAKLNMAATGEFEYVKNVHYVVHKDKIYIIDQVTGEPLYNPETATESRWNGGPGRPSLAQAIEAKEGLQIRDDPSSSKQTTAQEVHAAAYKEKVGASGTALGHEERFAAQGLSGKVDDIPPYYDSQLVPHDDIVSPDIATKLGKIATDVREMWAGGKGPPQLVLCDRNDIPAEISELLGDDVPHVTIDASWLLDQGTNRQAALEALVAEAGKPGQVIIATMVLARGTDIKVSDEAKALGGLQVRITARSGMSRDIDIQAERRAARSGDSGGAFYYVSPDDDAFQLSANPNVQLAVIQYRQAVQAHDAEAAAQASQDLVALIPDVQAEAAARLSMPTSTYHANAPPADATTFAATLATAPATEPITQPPPPSSSQTTTSNALPLTPTTNPAQPTGPAHGAVGISQGPQAKGAAQAVSRPPTTEITEISAALNPGPIARLGPAGAVGDGQQVPQLPGGRNPGASQTGRDGTPGTVTSTPRGAALPARENQSVASEPGGSVTAAVAQARAAESALVTQVAAGGGTEAGGFANLT
ncbi:MAG: hypothetical protein ACRDNZ_08505, partial [Streptosporangiaceae bacterium]